MAERTVEPGAWRRFTAVVSDAAARTSRCAREVARGAAGTHAYDDYLAHCRMHHPHAPVLSREEFFRREFTAKWEGIRRCC